MEYHRTHVSGEICCRVVCVALQKLRTAKYLLNFFHFKRFGKKVAIDLACWVVTDNQMLPGHIPKPHLRYFLNIYINVLF
jgi:hypothetical protein